MGQRNLSPCEKYHVSYFFQQLKKQVLTGFTTEQAILNLAKAQLKKNAQGACSAFYHKETLSWQHCRKLCKTIGY